MLYARLDQAERAQADAEARAHEQQRTRVAAKKRAKDAKATRIAEEHTSALAADFVATAVSAAYSQATDVPTRQFPLVGWPRVELHGLVNMPHLNGRIGIADRVNAEGRYVVRDVASGNTICVRPANISAATSAAPTSAAPTFAAPTTAAISALSWRPPHNLSDPVPDHLSDGASDGMSTRSEMGWDCMCDSDSESDNDVVQPEVSIQPSAYIFPEEVRPSQVVTNHLGCDGLLGGRFQSARLPVEFATASSAAAVSASATVRPALFALLSSAALSWAAPHDLSNPVPDDDDPDMPDWDACEYIEADQSDSEDEDDVGDALAWPARATAQPVVPAAPAAFTFAHSCQGSCGDATCTASAVAITTAEAVTAAPTECAPSTGAPSTAAATAATPIAAATPAATESVAAVESVSAGGDHVLLRPADRLWSHTHHWRDATDIGTAAHRLHRVVRQRKAALVWMTPGNQVEMLQAAGDCEAPEGSCEKCMKLPQCVVELMCGHWLCKDCMQEHVAQRDTGRSCPNCKQKTIRPESVWIRWAAPPTAEQRKERANEWARTMRNPITITYELQHANSAAVAPIAASPPSTSIPPAPRSSAPPPPPAQPPYAPTPQPTSAGHECTLEEYALALDQMRSKLLKQAITIDEMQQQHAEELAERDARHQVELSVVSDTLREVEIAHEELKKTSAQAEKVLRERVATLQQQIITLKQQIGGGNWLSAISNAKQDAAKVKSQQTVIDKLSQLAGGPNLRAKGENLLKYLQTHTAAVKAGILPDLQAEHPLQAGDVNLSPARVDQLCAHLEMQLMGAGAGNVARTRLLVSSLMKRPAVQRLMGKRQTHEERLNKVARQMVDSAAGVLGHLTTGKRGSRSLEDHERFEAIVAALTPDDASSLHIISTIEELLGIHHKQIERAQVHGPCLSPYSNGFCSPSSRPPSLGRSEGWTPTMTVKQVPSHAPPRSRAGSGMTTEAGAGVSRSTTGTRRLVSIPMLARRSAIERWAPAIFELHSCHTRGWLLPC